MLWLLLLWFGVLMWILPFSSGVLWLLPFGLGVLLWFLPFGLWSLLFAVLFPVSAVSVSQLQCFDSTSSCSYSQSFFSSPVPGVVSSSLSPLDSISPRRFRGPGLGLSPGARPVVGPDGGNPHRVHF